MCKDEQSMQAHILLHHPFEPLKMGTKNSKQQQQAGMLDVRTHEFSAERTRVFDEREGTPQYIQQSSAGHSTRQQLAIEWLTALDQMCIEEEKHKSPAVTLPVINIRLSALHERTRKFFPTRTRYLQLILEYIRTALSQWEDELPTQEDEHVHEQSRNALVVRILHALVNTMTRDECDAHHTEHANDSILHTIVWTHRAKEPNAGAEIQSLLCQLVDALLSQSIESYRPPLDALDSNGHTVLTSLLVKSSSQWLYDDCRMIKILRKHKAPFDSAKVLSAFRSARPHQIEILLRWLSFESDLFSLRLNVDVAIPYSGFFPEAKREVLLDMIKRRKENPTDECIQLYCLILKQLNQAHKRIRANTKAEGAASSSSSSSSSSSPAASSAASSTTDSFFTEFVLEQLSLLPKQFTSSLFISRFTETQKSLTQLTELSKSSDIDELTITKKILVKTNQLSEIVQDLIRVINEEAIAKSTRSSSLSSSSISSHLQSSLGLSISATHQDVALLPCLFALPTDILLLLDRDKTAREWLLHSIRSSENIRVDLLSAQSLSGSKLSYISLMKKPFPILLILHRPRVRGDFIWSIYKEMIQLAFSSSTASSSYPYRNTIIALGTSDILGNLANDLNQMFTYLSQTHLPESIADIDNKTLVCTQEQARLVLELLYEPDGIEGLNAFRFPASAPTTTTSASCVAEEKQMVKTDFFSLFFSRCALNDVKVWLSLTRDTHDCLWPSRASHELLHQPIIRVLPTLYDMDQTDETDAAQIVEENETGDEIMKLLEIERVRWEQELIPQMQKELNVWLIPDLARFALEFLIPNPHVTNFRLEKILRSGRPSLNLNLLSLLHQQQQPCGTTTTSASFLPPPN